MENNNYFKAVGRLSSIKNKMFADIGINKANLDFLLMKH